MYKKMISILVVVLVCSLLTGYVSAQEKYPEKPIQMVSPYSPGGTSDIATRLIAVFMQKYLGQPIIVLNKPGGATAVAGNYVFNSKPDGYTVGVFTITNTTPELLMNPERFTYKSKDVQAVAQWSAYIGGFFVKYDAPWKTLNELIEYAKKNPNKLRWSHDGRGAGWWAIGTLFLQQAGIQLLDVPFSGDATGLTALLSNTVEMSILTFSAITVEQLKAQKIRALCSYTQERLEYAPDVPTIVELGFTVELQGYIGFFVPTGTPKEVIATLSEATRKATSEPEFREKMKQIALPVLYRDTKELQENVKTFGENQWKLLKKIGAL